ncbi:flagellar motor protein MotB [Sulfitobacter sp. PS-8MA]|uniref:flagellar motor protein MotB n=1 Tax=Sulfitobacter sp. PS-8MA TaxID=3237707 RepID=UPI0034C5BEAB
MAAHANVAPVIIKRKKVVGGGGHHGGAWKVAYADFVTAMMAFFMLMWLLNATTEQQRKGIADYFSPTIPINRISGGGTGSFGGDSIFSEETLPRNGTGATSPGAPRDAKSNSGEGDSGVEDEVFKEVDAMLMGRGGETMVMENALRHIVTRITDEGLVIELFDLDGTPLFEDGSDTPTQVLRDLAIIIAETSKAVTNGIAIGGHVRANPVVLNHSPVWELSAARASKMRLLLGDAGIAPGRVRRVTGHADRDPVTADRMARRNNRLEIVLLRADR